MSNCKWTMNSLQIFARNSQDVYKHIPLSSSHWCIFNIKIGMIFFPQVAVIGVQFTFLLPLAITSIIFQVTVSQTWGTQNEIHYLLITGCDGLLSLSGTWCVHFKNCVLASMHPLFLQYISLYQIWLSMFSICQMEYFSDVVFEHERPHF